MEDIITYPEVLYKLGENIMKTKPTKLKYK